MSKLKVVTFVGTRPEIIRLSALLPKLDIHTSHTFVHTGQNSAPMLNDVFFRDLDLREPDRHLNVDVTSLGTALGETLSRAEQVLIDVQPDAVVVLGDTNSSIASIVAERMHIPVYHLEAGNRSFDSNVPEELNRKLVDHIASFNLPYTERARQNLLSEGLHPRRIQKTGSPIPEIYKKFANKIKSSKILEELELQSDSYILVSVHRQENVDSPERLSAVLACLRAVADHWSLPILVSTHPRTKSRLAKLLDADLRGINFHEPFGYLDYNKLQMESFCTISDSGTISEEASVMGFLAVSFRDSIERPESLETGSVLLTGLDPANLIESISLLRSNGLVDSLPEGYEVTDFSERVLRFIFSTARLHRKWDNLH